jgi:hypothetical protein
MSITLNSPTTENNSHKQSLITLQEMYQLYPNQWLLIVNLELDDNLNIVRGQVIANSNNSDELYEQLVSIDYKSASIEYIGDLSQLNFMPI